MYTQFFGLTREPFSIAPDPRSLYMSAAHREALAHLLYGIRGGGGFVVLTGEVGAGKTTVCRCLLEQVPEECRLAYVFNPRLSAAELLVTVCEEFGIGFDAADGTRPAPGVKECIDALNRQLLATHAAGGQSVLIIDEAQGLSEDLLEQLRLLTNLETNERKLLQIILIGQPNLRDLLDNPALEQVAQRVIARFHLGALDLDETREYVAHRWAQAGGAPAALPFDAALMKRVHRLTGGLPRRINVLCDRALLAAYVAGSARVDGAMLARAAREVAGGGDPLALNRRPVLAVALAAAAAIVVVALLVVTLWPLHEDSDYRRVRQELVPVQSEIQPAGTPAPLPAGGEPLPAWRALAALWKLPVLTGDPCGAAQQAQGLQCYRGNGGLAEIRQIDRPVVLALSDPASPGRRGHVLLKGLDHDSALLESDGETRRVSLLTLAGGWRGEFETWWRAPDGYRPGERGVPPEWLARQLARIDERYGVAPAAELSEALRQFQRIQGLSADGKPGPRTLMQINRLVGVDEPRLQSQGR